jgi:hypothetical protein
MNFFRLQIGWPFQNKPAEQQILPVANAKQAY